MELKELILKYREVQALRKALESKAKELRDKLEDPLMMQILQRMQDDGVKSLHYPEIGHVIQSARKYYEIIDRDAFAVAMLRSITTAAQEGRPLSEGMLAQNRPSKDILEDYVQHMGVSLEDCGVREVERPVLSIRQ